LDAGDVGRGEMGDGPVFEAGFVGDVGLEHVAWDYGFGDDVSVRKLDG
jgi:hypothetical protein